jgi:mono/diheme cytochrome c family protein
MHILQRFPLCLAGIWRGHCLALLPGLVLVALLAAGPGRAQTFGDPAEGRRLATVWCSGCHQIDPQTQILASDAIPSFQAIAAMPSTTSMSVRAFLRTSHEVMPDFKLTDMQIDDVGNYILSLRARRPE